MAATVMIVEFGSIHHYSSLGKILKLVCAVLWTHTKYNWKLCKLQHFGVELPYFKQQREYKLALTPLYAYLKKIMISSLSEGISEFLYLYL